jgi:7-keto-8-aminopelargonate synthetase-like enzyme
MSELKSKHQMMLEIVSEVADITTKLGVVHAETEDYTLDGRHIRIKGKDLLYFGSCSYLGLEHDARLKAAAIDSINRYGTHFASSRVYVSSVFYTEAEAMFRKMFGKPVLMLQSVTLGHLSNIPILVGDQDAVIMDANCHDSIQNAVQLLKTRDIHVELVRHSRLDLLEGRIKALKESYQRVWYLCDGVYSMHGDYAPIKELYALMDQYEQFYIYVDDIHGMSWTGLNGTGYVMSQGDYHPKMYLVTGLTKAFGSFGGLMIYPEEDSFKLVKNCSKAFIFSVQIPPVMMGATLASAKIHLTPEIYTMQDALKSRVEFFNNTAKKLELPLINETNSPICFIGVGKPDVGYNMVRRLMNAGHFINLSVFPSVSYNNTGLRITLNNNLTFEDIEKLLGDIAFFLPQALSDSNSTMKDIIKSFRLVA